MPVKKRASKRRAILPPDAWDFPFATGHDFFGDAAAVAIDPVRAPLGRQEAAAEAWRAAVRDAWAQHGADFLAARDPADPVPWALEQFGEPPAPRRRG